MKDKQALFIGYVWPEPNSSAAGTRMLQLLQLFQRAGWNVVYGSPAQSSQHAIDLSAIGVEAVPLTLNCSSFDDYIRHLAPDLVMFDRFMMEEQFGWRVESCCPNAVRILDTEDIHSLRHARHLAFREGKPLAREHICNELAKREIAAILRCDLSLVISEFELGWLTQQFQVPGQLLHYSPFMLDEDNEVASNDFAARRHFISIGNFRHAPNWDAVRYLKELWPAIRRQLPDAELHIYGAYPSPKVEQLHNPAQGFLVKGWVDDARGVIAKARVMLAPLRFGAGLKGKLVDAAACGTPAVTSSIGAEGLYGSLPSGLLISDDPDEFVQLAISLYQEEILWQSLSDNSRELIPRRFSLAGHGQPLLNRIEQLCSQLEQERQENFYGAMLRHHTLKSTQYMAQWIEAKNRLQSAGDSSGCL
ncbi:glycosyltransferase [Bowmanella dokdonensis]|uniref:Glycosyltransferase family 4 protein n=1 Tax=Bowmanella dokdonensis TaxID=751969 RepID=A0A939DTD6_9ALTE|nr:glycosyltransferase [Bowmanella dokdonensis]MBN7827586.1 glycosyltransferase family 4 protein [Bowmanella dokdonensis]